METQREHVALMATSDEQQRQSESIDRRRLMISTTSSLLVLVLCLFLPARTWARSRGWLFLGVLLASSILMTLYLRRVNPEVIAARINRHQGTKRWDLLLVMTFIMPTIVPIQIVAALDDGRFHWFPVPWWVCVLGYALLIIGMVGVTSAESVNKVFEPTDRGHEVFDNGPYAIIRHPGYAFG